MRAPTAASAALVPKHPGEKKRRLAGSFADEGKLLGLSVDSSSAEEARTRMDADPSVMAGFHAHEIHPVMLADLESLPRALLSALHRRDPTRVAMSSLRRRYRAFPESSRILRPT